LQTRFSQIRWTRESRALTSCSWKKAPTGGDQTGRGKEARTVARTGPHEAEPKAQRWAKLAG